MPENKREIVPVGIQMGHGYDARDASISTSPLQSITFVTDGVTIDAHADLDKRAIRSCNPPQYMDAIDNLPDDRRDFLFEQLNRLRRIAIAKSLAPGMFPANLSIARMEKLSRLTNSSQQALRWMALPNPALDNHTPQEYLDRDPEAFDGWIENLLWGQEM